MTTRRASDLDSPWKEALEHFLGPFLEFFFPAVHKAIDWSKDYVSLDKELQKIARDAAVGRRLADKLFRVHGKDGQEKWLFIHIEVQGRVDKHFAERMFIYNYRIFDLYHGPVASLAVLCDDNPEWNPSHFGYNVGGCEVGIRFLVAKLLDYQGNDDALEHERNPFAPVVMAQLKAMETQKTPRERHNWKVRLIKGLYDRGLKAEDVRQLFRLIDWMLVLPIELEQDFQTQIHRFQEERKMPYVTALERMAEDRGRQEGREEALRDGLLKGIAVALDVKFGAEAKRLMEEIRAVKEVDKLEKVGRNLKKVKSVDDLLRLLR